MDMAQEALMGNGRNPNKIVTKCTYRCRGRLLE